MPDSLTTLLVGGSTSLMASLCPLGPGPYCFEDTGPDRVTTGHLGTDGQSPFYLHLLLPSNKTLGPCSLSWR
jgi:hypothetical protein